MGGDFGAGFMQGFASTSKEMMALAQARQEWMARQATEKERLKLLQQKLKGDEAHRQLQEQEIRQRMAQSATEAIRKVTQQQQRQEAGSATALLTETDEQRGFALDPQTEAGLQGIVTRQMAAEGKTGDIQKFLEKRDDFKRRAELAQLLDPLLEGASPQQQAIARAALQAYQRGGLDDAALFKAFDKIGGTPNSMIDLAYAASGEGEAAERARRALTLLPEETKAMTISHLSWLSEGSGPEAERAKRALAAIRELRQTGVEPKERKGKRHKDEPAPVPRGAAPDPTFRGEKFEGTGGGTAPLPKVKSFRRKR